MTGFNANKRALFRRFSTINPNFLRPPWSIEEYDFVNICSNCTSCSNACPEFIIELDSRNQPIINFNKGECTFCGDCLTACESGALSKKFSDQQPWNAKVVLSSSCLAEQQTLCRSCGEVCEYRAIHFPLSVQGIVSPEINNEKCNGCGACIAICPTQALEIRYQN